MTVDLLVGFIVSTVLPLVAWALGYHLFKINPAVLWNEPRQATQETPA